MILFGDIIKRYDITTIGTITGIGVSLMDPIKGGYYQHDHNSFYIPDPTMNDDHAIWEYFDRCLGHKYCEETLIIYHKEIEQTPKMYNQGIIFVPNAPNWFSYFNIDMSPDGKRTKIEILCLHDDGGGAIKEHYTLLHDGRTFLRQENDRPEWMDEFKQERDFYQNPYNADNWTKYPYIKSIDAYYGRYIFKNKYTYVNINDVWILTDEKWLEQSMSHIPNYLQAEMNFLNSIK